jgi:enoyl-CoA hydratase/carnithine racemase
MHGWEEDGPRISVGGRRVDKQAGRFLNHEQTGHCAVVALAGGRCDEAACAGLTAELSEMCDRIAWDEETRVVVLEFDGEINASLSAPVARLKQPVIAAVRGNAIGRGLELALACDIRIGTESACFGLPQVGRGQLPSDGGTQRLPRLVGQGRAMEMILTGRLIEAREAQNIGLIHRVVMAGALRSAAMEIALEMAAKSPLSLRYAKEAVYGGMDLTLDQGVKMEMDLYLLLFSTRDRVEGLTAFKEKRRPEFEGT